MIEEIEKLRDVKFAENLSYEKIAKELNCSARSVYRWINRKGTPSDLALTQIRKFLTERKNGQNQRKRN